MATLKAKASPAETARHLDRELNVQNSARVSQGKEPLSQDEFIAAILSGLVKRPHWIKMLLKSSAILLAALFLAGCSILPLKPGHSSIETDTDGRKVIQVHQSQNPKDSTVQDYKRVTDSSGVTTEEVHTKIGAAQKDVAREIQAKLGSLKGIVWLGVFVFLFGVFSAFNPYLKAVVGSVTTSAAIAVAGLLLVVLPTLIVGNELLILGGTLGAAALWFVAHRHGNLRGQVETLKK